MSIKKIERNENLTLSEYDCIISLPSGMYKYSLINISREELKNFIKEQNIFSPKGLKTEEIIKSITFILNWHRHSPLEGG